MNAAELMVRCLESEGLDWMFGVPGEENLALLEAPAGSRIRFWAAGVAASPLALSLGVPLDRAGRMRVTPELTSPGRKDVFAIGDLAALEQDGGPEPGVAAAAIQEGRHVARNLARAVSGEPHLPFRYCEGGTYTDIERGAAVGVAWCRFHVSGFLAWLACLFLHTIYLIGFWNRLAVPLNWTYSYLVSGRSARLITNELGKPELSPAPTAAARTREPMPSTRSRGRLSSALFFS